MSNKIDFKQTLKTRIDWKSAFWLNVLTIVFSSIFIPDIGAIAICSLCMLVSSLLVMIIIMFQYPVYKEFKLKEIRNYILLGDYIKISYFNSFDEYLGQSSPNDYCRGTKSEVSWMLNKGKDISGPYFFHNVLKGQTIELNKNEIISLINNIDSKFFIIRYVHDKLTDHEIFYKKI